MTVVSGISNLDIALEFLSWRRRIEAAIVDIRRSPTSLKVEFSNYLMHRNPRRHLAGLETAIAEFLRVHRTFESWWLALLSEGAVELQFGDGAPRVATSSLSAWRQIAAWVDPDALIALCAIKNAPPDQSASEILAQLGQWRSHPEILDRDVRAVFERGLTDTHIHFEASDPIPIFWTRLQYGDVRLDAVPRYSDAELNKISGNLQRYEQRIWERTSIESAIRFRHSALGSFSIEPLSRTATLSQQRSQERLFLLRSWKCHLNGDWSLTREFSGYLAAKSRFLREQQQFPGAGAGLYRFREYLSRATSLIERNPRRASPRRLKARTGRLATNAFDFANLRSAELRISPRASLRDWRQTFRIWEEAVQETNLSERAAGARFTVHFARKIEWDKDLKNYEAQRKVLERESAVLHLFRHGNHPGARRIVGIDVAGAERDTAPEIFFPYLKLLRGDQSAFETGQVSLPTWQRLRERNLHTHAVKLPQLGQTFHVGEDFYHPITGLRHIDTLTRFLLRPGDRIGHGLVLGIDIAAWVTTNQHHMRIPRGILLDDLVWLRRTALSVAPERPELVQLADCEISRLSSTIYGEDVPLQVLEALGEERRRLPPAERTGTRGQVLYWAECNDPRVYARRQETADAAAAALLSDAALGRLAQKWVNGLIAQAGIVIEINPTSNLATGMIDRLSEHPVFRILEDAGERVRISINTDDPGVFATRLDWELGLMFQAFQQERGRSRHEALTLLERMRATANDSIFS